MKMEKERDSTKAVQTVLDWTVGEVVSWLFEVNSMKEALQSTLVELCLSQEVDGKKLQEMLLAVDTFDRFSKMAAMNKEDAVVFKEELGKLFKNNNDKEDEDYKLALRIAAGEGIASIEKKNTTSGSTSTTVSPLFNQVYCSVKS